jgi:hypothetical protein
MMRAKLGVAATTGVAIVAALTTSVPAYAVGDKYALNGTFIAASDGRWAKVNERYEDVPSIRNTWYITSTCDGPMDCHGLITSDQGWTAELRKPNQVWSAERVIPDWQHCPDGTTSPGRQLFRFWRVDEKGIADLSDTSPLFTGEDKTLGESGACGVSMWRTIRMPLLVRQLS